MEMKRDEAPAAEEFDLIGELREAYRVQSKDAAYLMFDEKGDESERVQLRANLMYMAADALAAERDRADRAEDALAEAQAAALQEAALVAPKWPQTRWTVQNWLVDLAAEKRAKS
jgi:hypothetical protein